MTELLCYDLNNIPVWTDPSIIIIISSSSSSSNIVIIISITIIMLWLNQPTST